MDSWLETICVYNRRVGGVAVEGRRSDDRIHSGVVLSLIADVASSRTTIAGCLAVDVE
jgi:hypothetical protein